MKIGNMQRVIGRSFVALAAHLHRQGHVDLACEVLAVAKRWWRAQGA